MRVSGTLKKDAAPDPVIGAASSALDVVLVRKERQDRAHDGCEVRETGLQAGDGTLQAGNGTLRAGDGTLEASDGSEESVIGVRAVGLLLAQPGEDGEVRVRSRGSFAARSVRETREHGTDESVRSLTGRGLGADAALQRPVGRG